MKTNKRRKMELSREVIRTLTNDEARGAVGGMLAQSSVGTCTWCVRSYCPCPPPRSSDNPLAC